LFNLIMNNYLKITAEIEDDETVGLTGSVSFKGFSGKGEAWFNISEVKQFISELEHFAKTTEKTPELAGGNWNGNGHLSHKLLGLRFYKLSKYRAGLRVELADYPYTDCRPEEISSVALELQPETQAIIEFCGQLNQPLSNTISEVALVC
ncbi:MAG: hypothetical protein KUG78_00360, partial [Kangiellaceae bacterium]|nr:hypothetical protein [Kangiellaceae bacterium]